MPVAKDRFAKFMNRTEKTELQDLSKKNGITSTGEDFERERSDED